jgi:hypothetical protein
MAVVGITGSTILVFIAFEILIKRFLMPFMVRSYDFDPEKVLKNRSNSNPRCLENPQYGTISDVIFTLRLWIQKARL